MTRKFALYNVDSETMLTGPVFDTEQDALDALDHRMIDVIAVPVDVPGRLNTYHVTYFDVSVDGDDDDPWVFVCEAEDAEHAMEQCEDVDDNYCVVGVALASGEDKFAQPCDAIEVEVPHDAV